MSCAPVTRSTEGTQCEDRRESTLRVFSREIGHGSTVFPGVNQSTKCRKTNGIVTLVGYVKVNGNHKEFELVIDTAATVNCVSPRVLDNYNHYTWTKENTRVTGANGSKLRELKIIVMEIEVGRKRKRTWIKAIVLPELVHDVLLGLPWLYKEQVKIDFASRIVELNEEQQVWVIATNTTTEEEDLNKMNTLLSGVIEANDLTAEQVRDLARVTFPTILSQEEVKKQTIIMLKYRRVWTTVEYGGAKGVYHDITLNDRRPIQLRARAIPQEHQQFIKEHVEQMERDKVIEMSTSPFCFYPVLVPKRKDPVTGKPLGGIRFCIDYRELNKVTVKDRTPLPRINDLVSAMENSKYFASLDLTAGYWQIPLRPEVKHYTAFRVPTGLYQYRVMPFGLVNAPATFQRWINDLLGEFRFNGVVAYLDDILIHASTAERYLELLEVVLAKLSGFNVFIKMEKCEFCRSSFNYLGHIFQDGRRRPHPRKVEALQLVMSPTNQKELRRVMGMLNFYHAYMPNFAHKMVEVTRLLKKNTPYQWTAACEAALRNTIQELASSVLRVAPTGRIFRLETDASNVAAGAVLYDKEEYDKSPHPIPLLFLSKTFNATQRRWSTEEKEAFAVVWALEASDEFIRGRPVYIITDHRNLQFIQSKRNCKIARWAMKLAEYELYVEHIPGSQNLVADCLSRDAQDDTFMNSRMFVYPVSMSRQKRQRIGKLNPEEPIQTLPSDWQELVRLANELPPCASSDDGLLVEKATAVEDVNGIGPRSTPFLPTTSMPTLEEIILQQEKELPTPITKGMYKTKGKWFYIHRIWVPPSLRERLLDAVHFSPPLWHPRAQRMKRVIQRLYNWCRLTEDTQEYVRSCLSCQRTKPGKGLQTLKERGHPVDDPFATIYFDFWGPITWNGMTYKVLTILDFSTKWAEACVVETKDSESTARTIFKLWISRFGPPSRVIHDNDPTYVSRLMEEWLSIFGIRNPKIIPYHPESNAPVEVLHKTLKTQLMHLYSIANEALDFPEALDWALMVYRSTIHKATLETPAYMTHGTDFHFYDSITPTSGWRTGVHLHRLEIIHHIRNEYRRRNFVRLEQLRNSAEGKDHQQALALGDLVLCRASPSQFRRKTGQGESYHKLISAWSVIARVRDIDPSGSKIRVISVVTGKERVVHSQQCRKLTSPTSQIVSSYNEAVKARTCGH